MRSRQGTFYKISNSPISIGMGNVLSTVSDKKIPVDNDNNGTIDWYIADITSATDYYPFGSPMDGRTFSSEKYRFGFNGQEKDDEVAGEGNSIDFGARINDSRLGRFLSTDPLSNKYPFNSVYSFAQNSVISGIDIEGLEYIFTADGKFIGKFGTSQQIMVVTAEDNKAYQNGGITSEKLISNGKLLTTQSHKTISNVATTIYKNNSHPKFKLFNDKISIETDVNYPQGFSPAAQDHSTEAIWVNNTRGGAIALDVSQHLDFRINNYWDLMSTMYHEGAHNYFSSQGLSSSGAFGEAKVYLEQMRTPNFKNCSKEYKQEVVNTFTSEINTIGTFVANSTGKERVEAEKILRKYVKQFNALNLDTKLKPFDKYRYVKSK